MLNAVLLTRYFLCEFYLCFRNNHSIKEQLKGYFWNVFNLWSLSNPVLLIASWANALWQEHMKSYGFFFLKHSIWKTKPQDSCEIPASWGLRQCFHVLRKVISANNFCLKVMIISAVGILNERKSCWRRNWFSLDTSIISFTVSYLLV